MAKKRADGKNRYRSGFCNDINKIGQHEGTKPKGRDGIPLPVCPFWDTCPCDCHAKITKMYEMADAVREPVEQSHEYLEYQRAKRSETIMPDPYDLGDLTGLSSVAGVDAHLDNEERLDGQQDTVNGTPAATEAPAARLFHQTPTGRRARGQLEYDVLFVCQEFIAGVYDWPECLPKLVAERIGRLNAVESPSTGAIQAVWDRWQKLNFAVQDKKPVRFVRFVEAGTVEELETMKLRAKRERKRTKSEMKRGMLHGKAR